MAYKGQCAICPDTCIITVLTVLETGLLSEGISGIITPQRKSIDINPTDKRYRIINTIMRTYGFPGGLVARNLPARAGDYEETTFNP